MQPDPRLKKYGKAYVSLFLNDCAIPDRGDTDESTLFDLHGAGLGKWDVAQPHNAIEIRADLFVSIAFAYTQKGSHEIRIEIELQDGNVIPIFSKPMEVAHRNEHKQFNVPLSGITLPIGIHYLWAYVDGVPSGTAPLWVYESKADQSE